MKKCIICRKSKSDFNDEHVIPDSLGGYYHIDSVCTECNGKLGEKVDTKLINHKFIEFQRHLLRLKGKKGHIPNPFAGDQKMADDVSQKVRMDLKDNRFEPYLIPNIKADNVLEDGFTVVVDARDEDRIASITDKILKRHGIPKEKIKTEKIIREKDKPTIHIQHKIDIKDFKIGLLKIAYEYTVDVLPNFYKEQNAILISNILENCDLDSLDKIVFFGSGFNKEILTPLSHFFDFENSKKHYLLLMNVSRLGLICFINLFDVVSLGIQMTTNRNLLDERIIIGVNDIENKSFEIKNMNDAFESVFTPFRFAFKYKFDSENDATLLFHCSQMPNFCYFPQNANPSLLDKNGNIVYKNFEDKLIENGTKRKQLGDDINENITEYLIEDELYIKVLPLNKLFRLESIRAERFRIGKI